MFATILGPYPRPDGLDDEAALDLALADQLDADLGMLADGRSAPDADPLAAWRVADARARALAAARGIGPRPVKARILGPYTAARASGGTAAARERTTLAAAEAGNLVLRSLISAGVQVVQVEEDGLTSIGPDDEAERTLAGEALHRLTDGVAGHLSLSVVGGDPCAAGARVLYDAPFSSHLFDLIHGPDGWRVARDAPRERGLILGVADCRTAEPDDEAVTLWAARYAASFGGRGMQRIALTTSAGLERLPRDVARAKLGGLAAAAVLAGIRDREALRDGLEFQALTRSAPPGRAPAPRRRRSR
jgi:hypothetical protein